MTGHGEIAMPDPIRLVRRSIAIAMRRTGKSNKQAAKLVMDIAASLAALAENDPFGEFCWYGVVYHAAKHEYDTAAE